MVTSALRADAWASASNLPFILLTITHPSLTTPIRVVNNRQDVFSNGNAYTAFPFEIVLPDSSEDAPPRARVRIDNVTREIGQVIRNMDTAASVSITVVRQEAPDTVEMALSGMLTGAIKYDMMAVEFDLEFEDLGKEPFPAPSFSPAEYPGLIR